jgi:hypothetical protein
MFRPLRLLGGCWRKVSGIPEIILIKKHQTTFEVAQYSKQYLGKDISDFFTFSFVRNPWDRQVSRFFAQRHTGKSFEAWIKDFEIRHDKGGGFEKIINDKNLFGRCDWPCYYWLCNEEGNLNDLNFIGRFENLNEDFLHVCDVLKADPETMKLSERKLPHKNKSNRNHYRGYYNSYTKGVVKRLFERDIDAFSYAF